MSKKTFIRVFSVFASLAAVLLISFAGATSLGREAYGVANMASWVQAVGSIAAVLAAVWVAYNSSREAAEERKRDARSARVKALMHLTVLVDEFRGFLEQEARFRGDPLMTDTLQRRRSTVRIADNIRFAFREYPLEKIPSFDAVKMVIQLRALTDSACDPQKWSTASDHIACSYEYAREWLLMFEHADLALQVVKEASERLP